MKKIVLYFIMFVLMMNCACFATTEEISPENAEQITTEETKENQDESSNVPIQATAIVTEVGETKNQQSDSVAEVVQEVTIEILEGEFETEEFKTEYIIAYNLNDNVKEYELEVGDRVFVQILKDENNNATVKIQEPVRNMYIIVLFIILLITIGLVGRKQGIKLIFGLAITILAIYFILIKGIFSGKNGFIITFLASVIITLLTYGALCGFKKRNFISAIATIISVMITGFLTITIFHFAKLSGVTEEAIQVSFDIVNMNFTFRDLIFASVVFSSLGACMNVGIGLTKSLNEIKNDTQDTSWKELFKTGMEIGREKIGNMTNTLVFVYGGNLVFFGLIFMSCNMEESEIINKSVIAKEIIFAMTGMLGVILNVPITAIIYAIFNHGKTMYKIVSDNKIKGQRSLKL